MNEIGKLVVLDDGTTIEYDKLLPHQQEMVDRLQAISEQERSQKARTNAALAALTALSVSGAPEYMEEFLRSEDPLPNAPWNERGRVVTPPDQVRAGQRRNAPCACGSGKKFKVCCLRA
jgi:uncharacterized protein YecA (UPF0149 family)